MREKSRKDIKSIKEEQARSERLSEAVNFPSVILLDTTSYCNLRCTMCGHKDMTRIKGNMKWELFTKLIDEIAEENRNARVWMVFFGEALLLKGKKSHNVYDMIKYAKDKGLTDVVLNSNGNLMDNEASENLISCGLYAIYIGIDAFNPFAYSKVRVGGDYNVVVNNVIKLIKLKEKNKVDCPDVYVQFVEMEENKEQIKDFVNFWRKQGAKVKIRPKVSWAGIVEASNLTLSQQERWPCYWAMRSLSVTDQGKVVTCAVDVDAKFVVGDVNNQSIKKIWNGPLKDFRRKHLERRYNELPWPCRDCKDWQAARAEFI